MNRRFSTMPLRNSLINRWGASAIHVVLGLLFAVAFSAPELAQAQAKKYEVLHTFKKAHEGGLTHVGLTLGKDGLYYGSTDRYGPTGDGTVFSTNADGLVNVLHQMQSDVDGLFVSGELLLGTDGNFYGTTAQGAGPANCGTLFRMSPAGAFTVLHIFGATTTDACEPNGRLVQRPDGSLYGTSSRAGTGLGGTLFLASLTGKVTVLHNFVGGVADGFMPQSSPVLMTNGDLYGTSTFGGTTNRGTVWRLDAAGEFSLLHSFDDNDVTGTYPSTGLCFGRNGQFYGQTEQGAAYKLGATFRISAKGKIKLLHAWGSTPVDGKTASGELIQLANGNFYGVTFGGGKHDRGIVFKMTPSGTVTLLHAFAGSEDGRFPEGMLVQGADGLLRGTTFHGGKNGRLGVIYEVSTH